MVQRTVQTAVRRFSPVEREKDPMQYKYATARDMELLIRSRTETLRAVNHLPEDYAFSEEFLEASREYFREGDQTTVLALEEGRLAGCATLCYIDLMPTFSHPSGRRGHLMNVYTVPAFRRRIRYNRAINRKETAHGVFRHPPTGRNAPARRQAGVRVNG